MHKKHEQERKKGLIKSVLPKTLLGRSLLILITPVFLIQILSTLIFFDRHWSKMTSRLAFAVSGEISSLVEVFEDENQISVQSRERLVFLYEKYLDFIISYDESDIIEDDRRNIDSLPLSWEAMIRTTMILELAKSLKHPFKVDVDFYEKWVEVRVQLDGGVLNISLPQRRLFSSTSYIFLIWVFCLSAILLLIAILFMRNQIRPIRRLALAAERFGKGRDVETFKVEGAKEVRQAGQAFLEMKTRIRRQISQRTEMLAGVSHDLRTPLTRLKLQVSMMGDSPDIYDMKRDIVDMERMIDGYLNFVRGQGRESLKRIDIVALLNEVTTSSKRQGCDVFLDIGSIGSLYVSIRVMALKRCFSNIITNASKFADSIWISLAHIDKETIEIVIEDNGPGIEEDKFEDVFRPFYRGDSARNQDEGGGVGLGLPIAMDIVHAHGGEIWLKKSDHGGLAVHISLPV